MCPTDWIRRAPALVLALVAVLTLAACGGETEDNAVDAAEQNTVAVGGVDYRVVLFRELNVLESPDDAVWTGAPPPDDTGLYMAIVRACAGGDEAARMTDDIHLEDAFGEQFRPRPAGTADEFEYTAAQLEPGECRPLSSSPASRTFDGAALVFQVPFESVAERPMVLVIGAPEGDGEARVQLDL